ncbi:MAG: NADH-quinone oxidoreductase subunit L [Planctomycetota bacterium]|nr:NADH-quinone oxidoreductase subunit L [Planctomycetota bacterium]
MTELWLIPALPLAGFLLLLIGPSLGRRASSLIGAGSVGASFLVCLFTAWSFAGKPITQTLWHWFTVSNLSVDVALRVDQLSLVMILVVTGVGFLIHLYSLGYMAGDDAFSRFLAYMDLFVAFMLTLVLGDTLLTLFVGWEGVGLCSYLLIGFWYRDPSNGRAARKAFLVTRVGDTAFTIALFILATKFHTLNIEAILTACQAWPVGSALAVTVAGLLLGGALGKSAQLPLQVWLPDAMAGPTPVSALIHAATMVTAGAYLIARMFPLFQLAPDVLQLVAAIGASTLVLAGLSACVQRDIKRVLAYSTISQIGYMFLALGVGAPSAAMFHLVTHAFFKALLFLGAGAVIHALGNQQDLFKMGGLRKALPATFWTFLIGSAALVALPPTGGFASKDLILELTWASAPGARWLWAMGVFGAFLTAYYTARMFALAFFGPPHSHVHHKPGPVMIVPLILLAAGSLLTAALDWPGPLGGAPFFSHFLAPLFPVSDAHEVSASLASILQASSLASALAGIVTATLAFRRFSPSVSPDRPSPLVRFLLSGCGFDSLYNLLFIRPFLFLTRLNRNDILDSFYTALAWVAGLFHRGLSRSQTGQVRWYAFALALGAVILLAVMVLL